MSRTAQVFFIGAVVSFLVGGSPAQAANELALGEASAHQGGLASIPLTLSTTDEVQGLEVAFEWDGSVGTGEDLVAGAVLDPADLVVRRIEADYMVMGVVVDTDGEGDFFIGPGDDLLLATAEIRIPIEVAEEVSTDITFVDSKYSTVEDGPLLDNLVTVGGLSILESDGLVLTDGSLTAMPGGLNFVYSMSGDGPDVGSSCGTVQILLDSSEAVQGYEVAIRHEAGLTLDSIGVGQAATDNGADFSSTEVLAEGGTVGVVLDLLDPFDGNVIPPGTDLEIATYRYCCGAEADAYALTFVDDELGTPPKSNVVVVDGVSYTPELQNGTFACEACVPTEPDGEVTCDDGEDNDCDGLIDCDDSDCAGDPACDGCVPDEPDGEVSCDDQQDNDCDGLIDCDDPDCLAACTGDIAFSCGDTEQGEQGELLPATGAPGQTATVCFYYRSTNDPLQGLSIAACTDCDVAPIEGTFDITGTIVESVDAEYVSHQTDTEPDDGDGCEAIIGILVDALPPFDGATLPTTDMYMKLGCLDYAVADDPALTGQCFSVEFCDGADGRGKVPIRNLVSIDNQSYSPQLNSCEICVQGAGEFHRGDCNFSNDGVFAVDIADAAATMSFFFGTGALEFDPPCLDACDSNDDGRIDLADVAYTLEFLFQFGAFPPDPGPGFDQNIDPVPPGPDPTPDDLDCAAG